MIYPTHEELVENALAIIRDNAKTYAEAKAKRVYLEEYRKSKKALLIQSAPDTCKTGLEKESYAYAHPEYLELLEGLKEAVAIEEELRFKFKAAELRFEQWRTMQANNRAELNRYST